MLFVSYSTVEKIYGCQNNIKVGFLKISFLKVYLSSVDLYWYFFSYNASLRGRFEGILMIIQIKIYLPNIYKWEIVLSSKTKLSYLLLKCKRRIFLCSIGTVYRFSLSPNSFPNVKYLRLSTNIVMVL